MKLSRNFVTPFITVVFIVVAITGLLMFFHVFDGYTEVAHEILGLFFVIFSVLHVIINWKSLKIHFNKRVFIPASIAVVIISAVLIVQQYHNPKFDTILLERVTKAPIGDVIKLLQVDSIEVLKRLEANGIYHKEGETMEAIWINNNVHPKKVFDLMLE